MRSAGQTTAGREFVSLAMQKAVWHVALSAAGQAPAAAGVSQPRRARRASWTVAGVHPPRVLASGRGAACVVTPPSQHAQQALSSVPAAVPPVPPRPAVTLAKSVKNAAELAGLREAHLRDGVALVRFLCWLEKTIASGGRCISRAAVVPAMAPARNRSAQMLAHTSWTCVTLVLDCFMPSSLRRQVPDRG